MEESKEILSKKEVKTEERKNDIINIIERIQKAPLQNDYIFKRTFTKRGTDTLLRDFLEGVLKRKVIKVEIQNSEIPKEIIDEKASVLDIKAEIDTKTGRELVNIEMQVNNEGNIEKRSVYYLSKNIAYQLKKKEEYQKIIPTIIICITSFKFIKRNSYHSIVKLKFEKTEEDTYINQGYEEEQENLTDTIEMHFIELPKFIEKSPGVKTKKEQWLWAISGREEKIEMAKNKNSKVKEAMELVEEILMDPKEREIYQK